ncbi:MAG: DUF4375 domain-containing protein [Filomicrobium sp.]
MALVAAIPIQNSNYVYDPSEPWALFDALETAVKHLVDHGGFLREELPKIVDYADAIRDYIYQVNNGGHAQFFDNNSSRENAAERVLDSLDVLGFSDLHAILFDAATYFSADDDKRLEIEKVNSYVRSRDYPDVTWLSDLDDRFYGYDGAENRIYKELDKLFKQTDQLKAVEDLEWKFFMRELIESNPSRVERLSAKGVELQDFIEFYVSNAPFKKHPFKYATELAEKFGFRIKISADRIFDIEGDEGHLHFYGYDNADRSFFIVYKNLEEVFLCEVEGSVKDESAFPKLPPLGGVKMERKEV